MQMFSCPICQTPYRNGEINFCTVCSWELRPYVSSEIPPELAEKEQRTLQIVKTHWEELQNTKKKLTELQEPKKSLSIKKEFLPDASSSGTATFSYVIRSETNQRENNEDSFQTLQIIPAPSTAPITILAVADGMGGHAYGEDASREALKKISMVLFEQLSVESSLNQLQASPIDATSLSQVLMGAVEQANAYVKRLVEVNKWGKAGSTVAIAAILENRAVVVFLGDSPIFHFQTQTLKLTKITEDHTVAGVLERAGMITPEMARYHEGHSRLEFYLGCPTLPREAPIRIVDLKPQDLLLLCTDGVSGSLTEAQISQILAENHNNLEQAADSLLKTALAAGETDNQTLILWRYPGQVASDLPNLENSKPANNSWPFETPVEPKPQQMFKTMMQSSPPAFSPTQTSENLEPKQ